MEVQKARKSQSERWRQRQMCIQVKTCYFCYVAMFRLLYTILR